MSAFTTLNSNSSTRLGGPSVGGFRLGRGTASVIGFTPTVDEGVVAQLTDLDTLLGRRIIPAKDTLAKLQQWANLKLTPRRTDIAAGPEWAGGSLADTFKSQAVSATDLTVAAVLDADAELGALRYGFDTELNDRWNELDLAQRTVLQHRHIRDLLIARVALGKRIRNADAAVHFVLTDPGGTAEMVDYALMSAARAWAQAQALQIPDLDKDQGQPIAALRRASLNVSQNSFQTQVTAVFTDLVKNARYDAWIADAKVGWITYDVRPRLYALMRSSEQAKVLTDDNSKQVVPLLAAQAATWIGSLGSPMESGPDVDDPFKVDFFVQGGSQLQVSTAAVKCASQLYYVMTLGEELGVFDAVRYFTHRYLFRDGFAVEDGQLRRDLENYVFSEQFPGRDEGAPEHRMMKVTQDAERRSFYRQVFDIGDEAVPGDGMANTDFNRLWKILMIESARYLERAQSSPNPESYVSRRNVMQAVEDLQYNLSTSCVGMATVMTPLMHSELQFVVNRILDHQEVRRHLVPGGGSWLQVVEKLAAKQGRRTRGLVLLNKGQIGYSLIRSIAEYTPSSFEQDSVFAPFITDVDAFITTQSILQEESESADQEGPSGDDGYRRMPQFPGMPRIPGMPADLPAMPFPGGSAATAPSPSGATGGDAWDF